MKKILILLTLLPLPSFAHDALVWGGPGACIDGCIDAAVHVTKLAGFDPMIVTPENFDKSLFETAKIWVQPGGKSKQASLAMGEANREIIRQFINDGGGYVGFCAGAFLTTPKVGTSNQPGLGIIQGKTEVFRKSKSNVSVQPMIMPDQSIKHLYWEGGPFMSFTNDQLKKVDVLHRYQKTNQIGGVKTTFGNGRVSVTGLHPEAPQWWYDDSHVTDPDGLDNDSAAEMIKWAAKN